MRKIVAKRAYLPDFADDAYPCKRKRTKEL